MKKIDTMKKLIVLLLAANYFLPCWSQSIGIGTVAPDPSAQLDITTTARGLLIPRMTSSGIAAISNPAKGLMVYDSLANQLMINMGTAALPSWQTVVAGSGWGLTGNGGLSAAINFIGTTDNHPLLFRINNQWAGIIDSANTNTHLGYQGGKNTLPLFGYNTGLGYNHMRNNTQGSGNTAVGTVTLYSNTTGTANTVIGAEAMYYNTTGDNNSAVGSGALYFNTTGISNTATGLNALHSNTSGGNNTAIGMQALNASTTGGGNTALGYAAMYYNSSGIFNTAVGEDALSLNNGSLGSYNTAVGMLSLANTTNSQYNTAIGYHAAGQYDLGYNNTILGANCGVSANGLFNCIAIGQGVICTASSQARIGNTATTSIGGAVGWSTLSDGRYKKDLHENVKGIDFIMRLRPLTYRLDGARLASQAAKWAGNKPDALARTAIVTNEEKVLSGFVAQDVEQAALASGYEFSGVDKPKNENDLYGLRYADFVVPIIKAMQEQQQMIVELQKQMQLLREQNKLLLQAIKPR